MQEEVAQARQARAELAKLQALRKQARPGPLVSTVLCSHFGQCCKCLSVSLCALPYLSDFLISRIACFVVQCHIGDHLFFA